MEATSIANADSRRQEELVQYCENFKQVLLDAIEFYNKLIQKLKIEFSLTRIDNILRGDEYLLFEEGK